MISPIASGPGEHIVHGLLGDELFFEQKAQHLGAEKLFHLIRVEIKQMAKGSIWQKTAIGHQYMNNAPEEADNFTVVQRTALVR